jgi:hypothetical protein
MKANDGGLSYEERKRPFGFLDLSLRQPLAGQRQSFLATIAGPLGLLFRVCGADVSTNRDEGSNLAANHSGNTQQSDV